jgi:putative addiction module component (TIGR02574 family)
MTALAEKIYNEALDLPTDERLVLIDRLLHISNIPSQIDIDQAWIKEAHHRNQEIEDGSATLIPGEEVFAEINKKLSK